MRLIRCDLNSRSWLSPRVAWKPGGRRAYESHFSRTRNRGRIHLRRRLLQRVARCRAGSQCRSVRTVVDATREREQPSLCAGHTSSRRRSRSRRSTDTKRWRAARTIDNPITKFITWHAASHSRRAARPIDDSVARFNAHHSAGAWFSRPRNYGRNRRDGAGCGPHVPTAYRRLRPARAGRSSRPGRSPAATSGRAAGSSRCTTD
jgi:hypothetical protein